MSRGKDEKRSGFSYDGLKMENSSVKFANLFLNKVLYTKV